MKLEEDFVTAAMGNEDWAQYMDGFQDLLAEQFKRRSIGLVCDFADEITAARTAVFPSRPVLASLLDEGLSDAILFLHHPATWDIRRPGAPFYQMDRDLLEKFKASRISIFAFHVPLDNFGKYSTSVTLAQALGLEVQKPFHPYGGGLCGVFGKTGFRTVQELHFKYDEAVGHATSLYSYGAPEISGGKVAVIAGGGNSAEALGDLLEEGVHTFVTGISAKNDYSKSAHDFAREKGINVLGGSHYSSEAFACKAMCGYFEGLGLPSRFIADEPVMEDM